MNYEITKFKIAVNIIDMLHKQLNSINTISETINISLEDIKIIEQIVIDQDNDLLQLKNDIKQSCNSFINTIDKIKNDKIKFVLNKYIKNSIESSTDKTRLVCNICKKYSTYNKTAITNHTRACIKKHNR